NEVIDNIEYERVGLYTLMPLRQKTTVTIDFDEDGVADVEQYDVDSFLKRTRLSRFDRNNDGLSPREFLQRSFLSVDTNDSKAIELSEWKKAYETSMTGSQEASYN